MKLILMILLLAAYAMASGQTRLQPWPDATVVADEWQPFTVPPGTLVWYGRDDRWITRSVSGAAACTNDFFQLDPFVGVAKVCAVELPPPYVSPGGLVFASTKPTGAMCAFSPKGDGTAPVVEVNGAGVAIGWWCRGPSPRAHLYAIRWSAVTMGWLYTLATAAMTQDLTARINMISVAAVDPIDKLYDVWGPSEARLLAARPAQ